MSIEQVTAGVTYNPDTRQIVFSAQPDLNDHTQHEIVAWLKQRFAIEYHEIEVSYKQMTPSEEPLEVQGDLIKNNDTYIKLKEVESVSPIEGGPTNISLEYLPWYAFGVNPPHVAPAVIVLHMKSGGEHRIVLENPKDLPKAVGIIMRGI